MKNKQKLFSSIDLFKRLPLNPCEAYYGGRTNATSLYKKYVGTEKIHYIDVVSMYPTVMLLPQYLYPVCEHEVRRFDDPNMLPIPLDQLFGLQKCRVIPPNSLYHPVLPNGVKTTANCVFHCTQSPGHGRMSNCRKQFLWDTGSRKCTSNIISLRLPTLSFRPTSKRSLI